MNTLHTDKFKLNRWLVYDSASREFSATRFASQIVSIPPRQSPVRIASSRDDNDLRYEGELSAPYPLVPVKKSDYTDPTIDVLFCDEESLTDFNSFLFDAGIWRIPWQLNIAPVATIFAAAYDYPWANTHFLTIREAAYRQLKGLEEKGLENLSDKEKRIYGCSMVASFLRQWVTIQPDKEVRLVKADMPLDIRDMRPQDCQLHFTGEGINVTRILSLDELCNLEQNGIFLESSDEKGMCGHCCYGRNFELNQNARRETNITSVACKYYRTLWTGQFWLIGCQNCKI